MAKTDYLTFRSTRLNLLFDYLAEIQGYRAKNFTKFTSRRDLREALVTLFCGRGDKRHEAEVTAEINLQQAIDNEVHMDELVELLNKQTKKKTVSEIDHVLELHIYVLK